MTNQEAIEIIKANYPPENYTMLREALDMALELMEKQCGTLGTRITASEITFTSTGTAKDGEKRGILLGKVFMHEWLYKELLHKGLLTDEIRLVFEQAKSI